MAGVLLAARAFAQHASDARFARGDDGVEPAQRAEALAAVMALRVDGALLCTGTHVRTADGRTWILTAAHCLFTLHDGGRLGARRSSLQAGRGERLELAGARLDPRFAVCANEGLDYVTCLHRRARDVALIPVASADEYQGPWWTLCAESRRARSVVGYGYGHVPHATAASARPSYDVFDVTHETVDGTVIEAVGRSGGHVVFGDSGAPLVSEADDAALGRRIPCITHVAAARRAQRTPRGWEAVALLQPVIDPDRLRSM